MSGMKSSFLSSEFSWESFKEQEPQRKGGEGQSASLRGPSPSSCPVLSQTCMGGVGATVRYPVGEE